MYCHFLMVDKDSMASIHVVKDILKMPLDRIVTADIWFDDETPADLPEVWEFKKKMDEVIKQRWGITVEHHCARERERERQHKGFGRFDTKRTYIKVFYTEVSEDRELGRYRQYQFRERNVPQNRYYGFPVQMGAWCNSKLKVDALKQIENNLRRPVLQEIHSIGYSEQERENMGISVSKNRGMVQQRVKKRSNKKFFKGSESEVVQYIGIAADEPERIARHIVKPNVILPLVEAGWDEDMCGLWCKYSDMLSPTYSHSYRDGCWFCHNQGVDQLRYLYKNYPYLWEKLLALDNDSPVTFHADGHTVHDFDRRFKWEDEGYKPKGSVFRWSDLEEPQMNLFQFLDKDGG